MVKKEDLPVHQLGRNDNGPQNPGGFRLTPKLGLSATLPGTTTVQPEDRGVYQSRTGRTDRQV